MSWPNKSDRQRLAEAFRTMHRAPPLLLLPNAWDPLSARIFEAAGFGAVATTSGGLAWALGYPDGEKAPWDEVVAATQRIVRTVRVPVSADIEAGYGETPEAVARSVSDIIRVGAVGINLEDGTPDPKQPVRDIEDAVSRIRAAREAARVAGVPIVINARIDLYLKHVGDDATRLSETARRAEAYRTAGADCIYPFGHLGLDTIAALAKAIEAPINIAGRAGMPGVAQLEKLGVARVSIASGATLATMSAMRGMAETLRSTGEFDVLESAMTRAEAQQLFATRSDQTSR